MYPYLLYGLSYANVKVIFQTFKYTYTNGWTVHQILHRYLHLLYCLQVKQNQMFWWNVEH